MNASKLILAGGLTGLVWGTARAIYTAPLLCGAVAVVSLILFAFGASSFQEWIASVVGIIGIFSLIGIFGLLFNGRPIAAIAAFVGLVLFLSVSHQSIYGDPQEPPVSKHDCIFGDLSYRYEAATNTCWSLESGHLVSTYDASGHVLKPTPVTTTPATSSSGHPTLDGIVGLLVILGGFGLAKKWVQRRREVRRQRAYEIALQYDPSAGGYPLLPAPKPRRQPPVRREPRVYRQSPQAAPDHSWLAEGRRGAGLE